MEKYTPRENIADYLVEVGNGNLVLLKSPVDWKEGEEVRKSAVAQSGIDVRGLCAMVCEKTGLTEITYDEMLRMCEQVLQIEESGQGVFPK